MKTKVLLISDDAELGLNQNKNKASHQIGSKLGDLILQTESNLNEMMNRVPLLLSTIGTWIEKVKENEYKVVSYTPTPVIASEETIDGISDDEQSDAPEYGYDVYVAMRSSQMDSEGDKIKFDDDVNGRNRLIEECIVSIKDKEDGETDDAIDEFLRNIGAVDVNNNYKIKETEVSKGKRIDLEKSFNYLKKVKENKRIASTVTVGLQNINAKIVKAKKQLMKIVGTLVGIVEDESINE